MPQFGEFASGGFVPALGLVPESWRTSSPFLAPAFVRLFEAWVRAHYRETLAPGDLRFVDVEQPPGQANCTVRESSAEQGRSAVLQGNRDLKEVLEERTS